MRWLVVLVIRGYQKTLSPDHGPLRVLYPHGFCRFHPTCSDYTVQAVQKWGVIKGLSRGVWRVMRCNPWNEGGYDPVEKEKTRG